MSEQIQVLDKGFVRLVDSMGNDESIVQAARTSYGKGTKTAREDKALIDYLMRHRHTSPFEMVEFKFHIKLPLFVFAQLVRHRTASLNAMSARYSEMPDEFYLPTEWRTQDKDNKQGSVVADEELLSQHAWATASSSAEFEYGRYQDLLESGVAREMARMVLPQNLYTEVYWKQDLHNLLHLLGLRLDPHAQWEIRQYAQAIYDIVQPIVPWTIESWENHVRQAVHLSAIEQEVLVRVTEHGAFNEEGMESIINHMIENGRLSKGYAREIRTKFKDLYFRNGLKEYQRQQLGDV